ncbi:hypothetical protein BT93_H3905 [Corymbia citriodora subsp. variegata]|nr:hypothetical protein BT93_H3905 [Corymbia citriodora subsp. variegata]
MAYVDSWDLLLWLTLILGICFYGLRLFLGSLYASMASDPGSSSSPSPSPVGYQVIASPLKIQEMEKPMEPYYEVFLSFRGPDTRHDITDILYNSLIDTGIRAYRDDEELRVGEEIGPELLQAIKQSKISIPIFSKEYAASKWCLMELVQMVECKERRGQKIMPIFYDVEPSEVRNQTASYGKAIQSHINKQRYTDETIENWKAALNKVGALKGLELKKRGKGEFTREVVQKVLIELKKKYLAIPDFLVEMDNHVDRIMEFIGEQTAKTKIIGIHGMGGVGKTTLAKIVYNKLLSNSTKRYNWNYSLDEMADQVDRIMEVIGERTTDFTICCSLSNIGDTKIESLQNQLISDVLGKIRPTINDIDEGKQVIENRLCSKKVILVLDDVDQKTQLDALVGMGKCWFCRGSKVIITTRNKDVLKDVDLKYELSEMDFVHSLLLFSRHAFRRDCPPAEYVSLSKTAVEICGGLPLALEIIGSHLSGKDIDGWKKVLKKLETIPNGEVKRKLNISFEALETQEQEIFLDVCCFFGGFDVRIATYMWDSCKFYPECSLEVLKQRSLIKIAGGNRLLVHDQLRDLGRDIVRERAKLKPAKQSRVWDHEEAIDVLETKEGRENVEAIRLKFDHQFQDFIKKEESVSLPNLRYLQVDCGDLDGNNVQHLPSTNLFQKNPIMLSKLRWLSWHNFPIFIKFTERSLMKLVILDLSRSNITYEWEGWNHLKMAKNLKVLNMTECRNLHKTPDFSAHEKLEQLILQGCEELVQVDRSIGELKELALLNLKYCGKLQTLPDEMEELEALRELLVDGTLITNIPEWKGMDKLETLRARKCGSLSKCNLAGCSTSLLYLDLSFTIISELPFGNFGSLVELHLFDSKIQELPNSIEKMKNLRVLDISQTDLQKLPRAIGMLEKLEKIDASRCRDLCGEIPSEIGNLSSLRILRLSDTGISNIPKLPESLTDLSLCGNQHMRCPDLSNLLNLRALNLKLSYQTPSHPAPSLNWILRLTKLEFLRLDCGGLVILPSDFNFPSNLRKLFLLGHNLERPPRLPQNLSCFQIRGCSTSILDLSYLERLSRLEVHNCEQLIEIQGLERLKNLQSLSLEELPLLVKLPDLTGLNNLWRLRIFKCPKLVEVRGQLESLESLRFWGCESLERLPDPLSFKHIEELYIGRCGKLEEIQGLEVSENLNILCVEDLPLLEKLPDLTNAKELRFLILAGCPRLVEIRGRFHLHRRQQPGLLEGVRALHLVVHAAGDRKRGGERRDDQIELAVPLALRVRGPHALRDAHPTGNRGGGGAEKVGSGPRSGTACAGREPSRWGSSCGRSSTCAPSQTRQRRGSPRRSRWSAVRLHRRRESVLGREKRERACRGGRTSESVHKGEREERRGEEEKS